MIYGILAALVLTTSNPQPIITPWHAHSVGINETGNIAKFDGAKAYATKADCERSIGLLYDLKLEPNSMIIGDISGTHFLKVTLLWCSVDGIAT